MQTSNIKFAHDSSEIDLALCRATLYSALALGFQAPTEETLVRLASQEGVTALEDAATILDTNQESSLALTVRGLTSKRDLTVTELSTLYLRLFGHTVRGPVPPYETEYGVEALFQQPQELADISGFYQAFGLTVKPAEHERADHVSCESEFLSFLALKEAYALEQGDTPMLEETRKATRLFLRDHLARFVPAFTKKLMREDRNGFYGTLGDLYLRFAIQECADRGVPLGPESLTLRPATDDRVPMACGGEEECPLMNESPNPEDL